MRLAEPWKILLECTSARQVGHGAVLRSPKCASAQASQKKWAQSNSCSNPKHVFNNQPLYMDLASHQAFVQLHVEQAAAGFGEPV